MSRTAHHRQAVAAITYKGARVFHDLAEGTEPAHVDRTTGPVQMHRKSANLSGDYNSPPNEFYRDIAAALAGADHILLVGHGSGHSSAMQAFMAYLEGNVHELAAKVYAKVDLDVAALSDAQILDEARLQFRRQSQKGW